MCLKCLKRGGLNKVVDILQKTFSNIFAWNIDLNKWCPVHRQTPGPIHNMLAGFEALEAKYVNKFPGVTTVP